MVVLALTENERRKQLSQIEVVRAHHKAINETRLTVQALADQLGMNRSTLSNNLRVLDLPREVLEHVESGACGITVAREFLALQNADHTHVEDMREVVHQIVNTWGRSGAPDWSRRHVRLLIGQRVSYNEVDFRPLGPRPAVHSAGAAREATFDVHAFGTERPDALHTIPAPDRDWEQYDQSRIWTCDAKAWRGWQTRATREATREAVAAGGEAPATAAQSMSRDKQFENVLKKDPVWKQITVSREKRGPNRPVNDQERQKLGTRAELREVVSYGEEFWKILQKGRPEDVNYWSRYRGGLVPPWFPDLKECQECTIGAAYAKSRNGYPLSEPTLVCFNQAHYEEKLQAGDVAYRGKLEARRKDVDRQDRKAVDHLIRQLQPLSDEACRALAASLLAAQPTLEWQHPLGTFHQDWSYESGTTVLVGGLVASERATSSGRTIVVDESLGSVEPEDIRKLIAALMVHHLRLADKLDSVSRETVALEIPV